ncbi:GNAT family N-acetyltransferase [Abyssibacter profundi]|uniref:GNAT family N-acetyltransferase n=1 Tax=Abyssibacter profundi TaxID=2182787 RepID=A0A363UMP5_9GAMM|nr:GNAT family N-acetyltransferase [Abyssibacter profundi]PWN56680.1 GNAT family N-acetyltransferase [Abyssibacter profundi]
MDARIRPITPADNTEMADIIWTTLAQFDACGDGFAGQDPETRALAGAYAQPRHAYFVAEWDGQLLGGAGVAPLAGGDRETAELRKMYLRASARGQGVGRALLDHCLSAARAMRYAQLYLETLESMTAARRLYRAAGFQPLQQPLGQTGHHGCDRWMLLSLSRQPPS